MANYKKEIKEADVDKYLSEKLRKVKYKEETSTSAALVIAIVIGIIFLFIGPVINFCIGYAIGWISTLLIGNQLVEGFALIGIAIPIEKIPLIGGIIGWVATFFPKSTPKNNN